MDSNAALAQKADISGTPECELLLKAATPDVYRKNSFRVLGLPIDTSLREAAKEVNRRRMLAELGQAESGANGRLEIRPAPTVDDLRAADAVLHDPSQRLVHELFWFWPLDPLSGQIDPALQAIKAGDIKAAASFWDAVRKDAGTPPTRLAMVKHNTAVRWHLHVLDIEAASEGSCWDDAQADNVRKTWIAALSYWNDSLHSEAVWNALSARVIAIDDNRASLEFVQSMRETVGRALLKINGTLALRYIDLGATTAALAHLSLILDSPICAENPSALDEYLVAPLKERVRQRIRDAEAGRTNDRSAAKDIAHRLITKFTSYLPLLNGLTAIRDTYDISGLFDEVVGECQSCVVAYYTETSDAQSSITLLETILPLARSEAVRAKVEENIATGKSNLLAEKLAPLHEPLLAIEESDEAPYNRLAQFVLTVEPLVTQLASILSMNGPAQEFVSDRISQLLRNISVAAWNTTKDTRTAFDALGRADKFARSAEVKTQLAVDRAALVKVYAEERREQQAKKNKKYAWFAGIGIAVAAVVIVWNFNGSSPTRASVQPDSATSSPAQGTDEGSSGAATRTYSVPEGMTEQLNRDRAAVDAAKREAADLDAQVTAAGAELDAKQAAARADQARLEDLGERIEQARPFVSNEGAAATSRFNEGVDRYNRMAAKVHREIATSNSLVDPYNALLGRAKAKEDEVNRLVEAYNEKLAQVSH